MFSSLLSCELLSLRRLATGWPQKAGPFLAWGQAHRSSADTQQVSEMNVQVHSGNSGLLALDPGPLTPCSVLLWSLRRLSGSLALQHQLSSGFRRPDKPPFSLSLPPSRPPNLLRGIRKTAFKAGLIGTNASWCEPPNEESRVAQPETLPLSPRLLGSAHVSLLR